jgi:multiple sugar transport system substrate-binding protein
MKRIAAKSLLTAITALALAACSAPGASDPPDVNSPTSPDPSTSDTFDWKRFSGQTLSVYIADTGQAELLQSKLAEFEELTGMTVSLETADVTSYRQTLPVRLTAQAKDFDVMATYPEIDGLQFSANGWYVGLDDFINNPSLTSPEFDFADFGEGLRRTLVVDGATISIPWEMQTALMYYRKDLLEAAGLELPNTYQEWEQAAAQIHDPAAEVYGFALRGIPYQTTTPYSVMLYGYCGAWVTDGKASINTEQALDAYEVYGRWGATYGPPGITGFDWPVPAQQFAQGKVFAFLDNNLFVATLENPDESTVVGQVGYALVPEGPCGRTPFIGGWGYGLNPFSAKQEAGWYFIQWASSAEINLEMKLTGWPSPRSSAWQDPGFQANDPTPEFTSVVLESTAIASAAMNPPVAPGVEAREIAGQVSHHALEGWSRAQLQELADQQNAALQQLIDTMS